MIVTQTVMVSSPASFLKDGPDFNVQLVPNDSVAEMEKGGWIAGPQVTFSIDIDDNELRAMIKHEIDKQRTDLICQLHNLEEKRKAFDQEPIKPTPTPDKMYGDDIA